MKRVHQSVIAELDSAIQEPILDEQNSWITWSSQVMTKKKAFFIVMIQAVDSGMTGKRLLFVVVPQSLDMRNFFF